MTRRRVGVLLVAVMAMAFLGHRKRPPKTGPVGIATDQWMQLGSVHLKRCPLDQQRVGGATYCATFAVPEDWTAPNGRLIDLRVQVVRSSAEVAASDLVVLLSGGPGQAATESFDAVAGSFEPLLKHRHVLLVDQRGTGSSHPLRCAAAPDDDDRSDTAHELERIRAHTKACLTEVEKTSDPRFYTTTDAIHDLDALRVEMGSPQLDLVGQSYGTRVAQQVLATHPDAVRSVVLDGVVPNSQALGQRMAVDFESALKAQLARCTADRLCKKRFGDPFATLQRVRSALHAAPQRVTYRDPLTFEERTRTLGDLGVAGLLRLFSYSTETAALMPLVLDEADHGRYAPLVEQIALVDSQLEQIGRVMSTSVVCTEDVDLLVPRPEDKDLVLGDTLVAAKRAECAIWPHGTRPATFHDPVHSDKPVLLLSGELDPVTPPANAVEVLRTLTKSRHLVAHGHGHGAMLRGCMPQLVERFIADLDPAALDASCLDVLGATPAFTSFLGAAP